MLETQRRHVKAAIVTLRTVVSRAEDVKNAIRPEMELTARTLLIETLLRQTTELDEAEEVLNKAVREFYLHL